MQSGISALLLVVNPGQKGARQTAREVASWLKQRQVSTVTLENTLDQDSLPLGEFRPQGALVLGGDGTLLAVARKLRAHQIPLLGINLGHVGFLTEVEGSDWHPSLERLLAGQAWITQRMALEFAVYRDQKAVYTGWALNDVVINRGSIARLIALDIAIDAQKLGSIRADGLIMATPTGTTAYAISAGGPLVHPELKALCLTPISPFLSQIRPMVLGAEHRIRIRVASKDPEACLTLDGQVGYDLVSNDEVWLWPSNLSARFFSLRPEAYLEKLQSKGYF